MSLSVVVVALGEVVFARQALPPNGATETLAQSTIIYLNKGGATLRPGVNDSRVGTSSLVPRQVAIPAWTVSAQGWTDTVACFHEVWSRFGVTVVETDPGNVPHIEAVFGGTPALLDLPTNVGGVSPFTLDCGIIENSIVFEFTAAMPGISPRHACEIMAQEVAHSYGLDHELLASDPMTYLSYSGNREFQDQTASCGEMTARPCGISGASCRPNQNSVQLLSQRVGMAGDDNIAPTVDFASPADGATVPPGFEVHATASDNVVVASAALFVDGAPAGTLDGAGPFVFATDAGLGDGTHAIEVSVSDGRNTQTATHVVTVEVGAMSPTDTWPDLNGGCSTTGGTGLALGLALMGLVRRRRRWKTSERSGCAVSSRAPAPR